jgi:hypothetical protein
MSSTSLGSCVSARTETKLSRSVAQGLADALNGALNRTVSDSRLSVEPIVGYPDAFELTRVVDGDDVPLELDGTTARLYVQQVVVVEDGRCRTESYVYRLQADESPKSWLMRWEYRREPPVADYPYELSHVHMNGTFFNGTPADHLHVPTERIELKVVIRHLITEWGVKPRTEDWKKILEESAEGFSDAPSASRQP